MENLTLKWIRENNSTTGEWWNNCVDLAEVVLRDSGEGKYLFIAPLDQPRLKGTGLGMWSRHVVPIVGGYIHDLWCEVPSKRTEYLINTFRNESLLIKEFTIEEGIGKIAEFIEELRMANGGIA